MGAKLSVDEVAVQALVGPATYLRGYAYARDGAVSDISWNDQERVVCGRVHGSAARPYTTLASITRSEDETVVAFRGVCSCPVGDDCKHSVALLLAGLPVRESDTLEPEPESWTAPWERTLALLIEAGEPAAPTESAPTLALQFDVRRGPGSAPAGATIRPVVPGRKGAWIRTGIEWSTFQGLRPGVARTAAAGRQAAARQLFADILALTPLTPSAGHYGYREPAVRLESFTSGRVWELLARAHELGIPLLQSGPRAAPVTAHATPVQASLDVARRADVLEIAPRLTIGSHELPADGCLLLGDPAHGVAWWAAPTDPGTDAPAILNVAPLSGSAVLGIGDLLRTERISIPVPDNDRFLHDFYPSLRRLVPVTSADGSVALPEPAPPTLALSVAHRPGPALELHWEWVYAVGAAVAREPVRADGAAGGRDLAAEQAVLAQVLPLLRDQPELFDAGPTKPRLVGRRVLAEMSAVRFVTESLPALQALDCVEISVSGHTTDYREAEHAPTIEFASTNNDADDRDWFNLEVNVSIDGEPVPFRELFVALAEGREFLILASGTYFRLDSPEFTRLAELIAESRELLDAPAGTVRLGRYHASMWDDLEQVGRLDAESARWQRAVSALASTAGVRPTAAPAGLVAQLRPYQQAGFDWLAFLYEHGLGGVLADEMGLGKTVQALALFCHVHAAGGATNPFLVVAPTSVTHNWAAEARRFAPHLRVVTIAETQARRGIALSEAITNADVVITSYTLFRLEHAAYAGQAWAGLVLDEAQFVKNHRAAGYRCARELTTPFKLAITGTPMENNLMELWALLSITAPGLFPEPGRFEHYYRMPIERDREPGKLAQLRRRIRPLMLRRTKGEVLADLPDKQEQVIELDLNTRHRKVYERYLHRERQKVLGLLDDLERNRFEIFRSLTLLRQASLDVTLVDPAHALVPSTKLDALMDHLDEIVAEGHRVIVFSQFTRFLDLARKRLEAAGVDYRYLDGKTRRRGDVIADFKQGAAPVFLISLKAGGYGLNLTEADYCIVLDPWWNPATEAQAVDRIHRIGQTRKVMVYRMVARDTIEEKVMALKDSKAALFRSVMDSGDFSSAALTAEEIRALVA